MASAHHLVNLMQLCLNRNSCPNPKIIKNLTNFLCYDINNLNLMGENSDNKSDSPKSQSPKKPENNSEIITLSNMQKVIFTFFYLFQHFTFYLLPLPL